jgi:type II secretion system protein G
MRRHQQGFTLIELLVVIVIIGLLATIAIPKFANTKEKAYLAQMKTDLRNLATVEEAYLYDNNAYTSSFPATIYTTTAGVNAPTITLEGAGWKAWVSHVYTPKTCAIFVNASALAPAIEEGAPACTP